MAKRTDFIFGIHPILEALDAGKAMDKLMLQRNFITHTMLRRIHDRATEQGIPVAKVPTERLNRVTRKNHQGAIAFMAAVTFGSLENVIAGCFEEGKMPLILVLDGVTDVRNFGAIVRTAECAGVDALVVPAKNAARIGEDAVKTSAGALHRVPVTRHADLREAVTFLQQSGLQVVACTEKTTHEIYTEAPDLSQPTALVMGDEGHGISEALLRLADRQVRLPMQGEIGSLNVSVAAGVLLYEAVRQRKKVHSK